MFDKILKAVGLCRQSDFVKMKNLATLAIEDVEKCNNDLQKCADDIHACQDLLVMQDSIIAKHRVLLEKKDE